MLNVTFKRTSTTNMPIMLVLLSLLLSASPALVAPTVVHAHADSAGCSHTGIVPIPQLCTLLGQVLAPK